MDERGFGDQQCLRSGSAQLAAKDPLPKAVADLGVDEVRGEALTTTAASISVVDGAIAEERHG